MKTGYKLELLTNEAMKLLGDGPAAIDLAGNTTADKITSLSNKPQEEPEEIQGEQEIIIPPERKQQIIDDLRLP